MEKVETLLPDIKVTAASILAARLHVGRSQGRMADLFGVTPATWSRWETGKHKPVGSHLRSLQKFVNKYGRPASPKGRL